MCDNFVDNFETYHESLPLYSFVRNTSVVGQLYDYHDWQLSTTFSNDIDT